MKTHPTGAELKKWIGKDDPVILDIGCNDGEHTAKFLEVFPRARVYCFEPDARALERFQKAIGIDARVRVYPIALSDRDGETEFYPSSGFPNEEWSLNIPTGWDRSGSIRKPKHHLDIWPWCKFGDPVTVETMRLDTWASRFDFNQIDLVWADVQGAEGDLLKGAQRTIKNVRYFFTEYSEMELYEDQVGLQGIFELLPGFSIISLYKGWNAMFRNETEAA